MERPAEKTKKQVGALSSLLVLLPVIIAAFLLSLLMNWLEFGMLAAMLFAAAALGLVSRLWGLYSLRAVDVRLTADKSALAVGDTALISYTVTNNKLLPVIWLELCSDAPARACLTPDSGFSRYELSLPEAQSSGKSALWRRRVIFLLGYQSVSWDTVWSAKRRGLHQADRLTLRSGDGFGLTQSSREAKSQSRLLVVWPKIVPVDAEGFFRNVWQGPAGRRGHVEDPTVLRGHSDYVPGDPWKRIDWRVAARSGELQTRRFETMLPGSVHFILDAASFLGKSEENDELEEAISVLASLILELGEKGIRCGLSLPGGASFPAVNLAPDNPEAFGRGLLYRLSALDADAATCGFDEAATDYVSQSAGQVWLVTYSGGRLSCPELADRLENIGLHVLCHDDGDPGCLAGRPFLRIRDLQKAGRPFLRTRDPQKGGGEK